MKTHSVVFWEVDVQADFMLPGGKLYVPGAEKIIPNVERLVRSARDGGVFLVSSGDAHAPDDPEFKVFPPHCVRERREPRIIPQGLRRKYLAIPNEAPFALPANVLDYPQVVLEKQTLDVFDNPKASELVRLLSCKFGARVGFRRGICGVSAWSLNTACDAPRRDSSTADAKSPS